MVGGSGWCSWYRNSLQAGWAGNPILVRATFSTPVQTRPEADPASYTKGTGSLCQVYKLPGHDIDHPTPPIAKLKE